MHLLFEHALFRSQSELDTHSGRQPVYGSPKYSGKQEHEPTPLRSLHNALAPHGDGLQGFGSGSSGSVIKLRQFWISEQRFDCFSSIVLGYIYYHLHSIREHPLKGSPV